MHAADRVTVSPVDEVYAGPDDVTDAAAKGYDGTECGVKRDGHLGAGVADVLDHFVHDCRATGDQDAVSRSDRARVSERVLPRTTGRVTPA
jgi:hypothetical protein